ncbi:MAG: DUF5597 domain-containing protein [Lewinella sp.]
MYQQILIIVLCLATLPCTSVRAQKMPHFERVGSVNQLIVEDQAFLILGGELGNSTFTSTESMALVWPKLKAMHLNTVLAPVYWELLEPEEGSFDFELLDQLILEARKQELKLVLLWFGSWKNSMSSHAPAWVKLDQEKYPRIKDEYGVSHEILTPFSEAVLQADKLAYVALMEHLKTFDGKDHTVIMVQPENEIGMLPSARDHGPLANEKYRAAVPQELLTYLQANKERLVPELFLAWGQAGFPMSGNWEEVFGVGEHTEEIFMAWYYARFTNELVVAGKASYPLPMFVNAALNTRGRRPGEYPSAGPLPHLMNIWQAGAPDVDMLSPDFYTPDFKHWMDLYDRLDNTLFVPEHRFDNTVAAKAAYAIGHYEAIGFSPFSIESKDNSEEQELGKIYALLDQLTPLITQHQGRGKIEGVLLDKVSPSTSFTLGDYVFTVKHSHTLGWEAAAKDEVWEPAGAVFIQTGENEFYVAGSGIVATFAHRENPDLRIGILKCEAGAFRDDKWTVTQHLNGDQTHQGRHLRIFRGEYGIQRLELYGYE